MFPNSSVALRFCFMFYGWQWLSLLFYIQKAMKINHLIFTSFLFLALFATGFSQVPNYVPTNGLVGWWPFNGNANDESGNGNHGSVNGASLTGDRYGTMNKAYYFSGTSYINVANNTVFNFGNSDYSISTIIPDS